MLPGDVSRWKTVFSTSLQLAAARAKHRVEPHRPAGEGVVRLLPHAEDGHHQPARQRGGEHRHRRGERVLAQAAADEEGEDRRSPLWSKSAIFSADKRG